MSKKNEKTEVEVQEKETVVQEATEKENLIYLGPTVPNILEASTVFKYGLLPEEVKKKVEEIPLMEKMFVKLSKMLEAVEELGQNMSSLNVIYKKVANEIKEGRDDV